MVFIDIQSTGLDPKTARIVRLSTLKLDPDGSRSSRQELIDPESPIPPGATAVHGIRAEDVEGRPPFRSFAAALRSYLHGSDLAGFGIERFGLPLLKTEFARAGVDFSPGDTVAIDAMSLFHRVEPRDFAAAYRRFVGGEPPVDLDGAEGSFRVLEGQLDQFPELPDDVGALADYIHPRDEGALDPGSRLVWSEDGQVLLNFGRHRGESLSSVAVEAPDYLHWVASNDEFDDLVRSTVLSVLRGETPVRPDERTAHERAPEAGA